MTETDRSQVVMSEEMTFVYESDAQAGYSFGNSAAACVDCSAADAKTYQAYCVNADPTAAKVANELGQCGGVPFGLGPEPMGIGRHPPSFSDTLGSYGDNQLAPSGGNFVQTRKAVDFGVARSAASSNGLGLIGGVSMNTPGHKEVAYVGDDESGGFMDESTTSLNRI
jgi:hypothetical protein